VGYYIFHIGRYGRQTHNGTPKIFPSFDISPFFFSSISEAPASAHGVIYERAPWRHRIRFSCTEWGNDLRFGI